MIVISGYWLPRLVNKLCVHSLSQSFASRKAQQILTPAFGCLYLVTTVKMSLWFYSKILIYIPRAMGIVRSLLQLVHWMGRGAALWSVLTFEMGSKTERFSKLYLHVAFKKPAPQFS